MAGRGVRLALLVVLGAFLLLSSGSVATDEPEATTVVMVGTGDPWDIAADHADDGEVIEMMAHIKDLNDSTTAPSRPARSSGARLDPPPKTSSADSTPAGGPGEDEGQGCPQEASPLTRAFRANTG